MSERSRSQVAQASDQGADDPRERHRRRTLFGARAPCDQCGPSVTRALLIACISCSLWCGRGKTVQFRTISAVNSSNNRCCATPMVFMVRSWADWSSGHRSRHWAATVRSFRQPGPGCGLDRRCRLRLPPSTVAISRQWGKPGRVRTRHR